MVSKLTILTFSIRFGKGFWTFWPKTTVFSEFSVIFRVLSENHHPWDLVRGLETNCRKSGQKSALFDSLKSALFDISKKH